MKSFLLALPLAVAVSAIAQAGRVPDPEPSSANQVMIEETRSVTLDITGMT